MKNKIFSFLLLICLCVSLAACSPSKNELAEQAALLIMQDAQEQLEDVGYCRVVIETLESNGKNEWSVTGNVNYTDIAGATNAVLYTATLRYDAGKKTFSTKTVFGDQYVLD